MICAIVAVLATLWVCIANPKLSKRVVIFDSHYEVVDQKLETKPLPVTTKTIDFTDTTPAVTVNNPIKQAPVRQISTEVPTQRVETVRTITPVQQKVVQTQKTPVSKTQKVSNTQTSSVTKKVSQTTPAKSAATKPVTNTPKKTVTQATPSKPVQQATTPKVLTPQQETILWNKWRSNIQNKIMKEVNLPTLENGVLFKFQFDVDKNGRITRVKTWSTNSEYTPYAIQYITPVIRGLQGKSILNFPEGSNRESTTVEGNIKISNQTKYATAGDYNDVEKIRY